MRSGEKTPLTEKKSTRWSSLSTKEKKQEFKELISSPYWHFLPENVQERIRKFFPLKKKGRSDVGDRWSAEMCPKQRKCD
jgi:hypothetical protein